MSKKVRAAQIGHSGQKKRGHIFSWLEKEKGI